MKKFFKLLGSYKFVLALTFLLNVAIFVVVTLFLGYYFYIAFQIFALLVIAGFLNKNNESPSYKLMWMAIVMVVPLFGAAFYYHVKGRWGTKRTLRAWQNINHSSLKYLEQDNEVVETLTRFEPKSANLSKYALTTEKWPVYTNTTPTYLKDGETYFEELFEELKSAKKFIFLEYFIIQPGKVWEELFNILRFKAREGVEVKLIYDDFGCVDRFSDKKFFKKLINHGIDAVAFNRIVPTINSFSQYRDHRKIVVIDGKTAFTGGINIGDEYANLVKKYGHWKDSGIKIVGDAVWNFTVMFLNNWQAATKKSVDVLNYKVNFEVQPKVKDYVQPYGTGPVNNVAIARNIYMKAINSATKYIYITTPYFIIDQELMDCIKLASLSGVDVRIVTPGIPDKKWVFYLTRSYYEQLLKAGVKIYEYSPGFMHAKMLVTDDDTTIIGTTNFDFRSLYLHFECGTIVHNSKVVASVKQDMDTIMVTSHLITLRDVKQRKWYEKMMAQILKFFAPLM